MARDVKLTGGSLRVTVVHNHYRSNVPSGENRTVNEVASQLSDAGVAVSRFERFSDDIGQMSFAEKSGVILSRFIPVLPPPCFGTTPSR